MSTNKGRQAHKTDGCLNICNGYRTELRQKTNCTKLWLAHGKLCGAGGVAPLPDAPPEGTMSSSPPDPSACSCLIINTAKRSSLLSWRAFPFKRRLRRCAFFNSFAARLRSSRMRNCSLFISAIVAESDVSPPSPSSDVARRWEPSAATRRSAARRAAASAAEEP